MDHSHLILQSIFKRIRPWYQYLRWYHNIVMALENHKWKWRGMQTQQEDMFDVTETPLKRPLCCIVKKEFWGGRTWPYTQLTHRFHPITNYCLKSTKYHSLISICFVSLQRQNYTISKLAGREYLLNWSWLFSLSWKHLFIHLVRFMLKTRKMSYIFSQNFFFFLLPYYSF